jgi:hypothetical protein
VRIPGVHVAHIGGQDGTVAQIRAYWQARGAVFLHHPIGSAEQHCGLEEILDPSHIVFHAPGTTDGAQWIYTGVYGPSGNVAQRRDNSDPSGMNVFGSWGFSWPANRRILYNRASADPDGKPWSDTKKYVY